MRRANMGLGSCGSRYAMGAMTPSAMPSRLGFTAAPRVFLRPTANVPLTFAACPPGYSTHKIGGESKCCKMALDEQGHLGLQCIEKGSIAVVCDPHNPVCPPGQLCVNGTCT